MWNIHIQAGLVLRDIFLRDVSLTRLENFHHFPNGRSKFRFNVMWQRRPVAVLVLCWRLTEWRHCHAISHVCGRITLQTRGWCSSPSTALACVTKMSKKRKSSSRSGMQVKNWRKTISVEEKLNVISRLARGELYVDVCRNVSFSYISVSTIRDNADGVTESTKSGTKVLV